jgi:small GTP-binding protein
MSENDGGKLILAGAAASGKTCLVMRLVHDIFREDVATSLTAAYVQHEFERNKKKVMFRIWDTAGQERFKAVTPAYFRGANILLFCFDTTS